MDKRNGILAATILGSSMVFIDSTVVNVILPRLQSEFHVSGVQIQWVVDAYLLFLSALILLGGTLGDHFGRRVVFEVGIVVFTLASVGCGLSQTLWQLTLARCVQGIGGAMLTPGSLAIIDASFPRHGTWQSHWNMGRLYRHYHRPWPRAGRLVKRQPLLAMGLFH